ncbi:MAG: hypothetical protein AB1426_06380 [Bacillota bacterium]
MTKGTIAGMTAARVTASTIDARIVPTVVLAGTVAVVAGAPAVHPQERRGVARRFARGRVGGIARPA